METLFDFRTMSKSDFNSMSSETYAAHFNGPDGPAFRERVDFLEGNKSAQPATESATQPAQAVASVQTTLPAEPTEKEQRYEFQPTDAYGRPIGGKQVIVHHGHDLVAKLEEQNVLLIRELRKRSRERRLAGVSEAEVAGVPKASPPDIPHEARDLTPSERVQHARLIAESRHREAAEYEQKCMYGVTVGELVQRTGKAEVDAYNARVGAALNAFMVATPDYVRCEENAKTLVDYMIKGNLDPTTLTSWVKAYDAMKDYLETKKPAASVPAPVSIPETAAVTAPAEAARAVPPIATGLTRRNSSDPSPVEMGAVPANGKYPYTLEQIRKMDSNTYGKLLRQSPAFGLFVDKLEADEAVRRAGKRSA